MKPKGPPKKDVPKDEDDFIKSDPDPIYEHHGDFDFDEEQNEPMVESDNDDDFDEGDEDMGDMGEGDS